MRYIASVVTSAMLAVVASRIGVALLVSLQATYGLNVDDAAPAAFFCLFACGPLAAGGIALGFLRIASHLSPARDLHITRPISLLVAVISAIIAFVANYVLVFVPGAGDWLRPIGL